MRGAERPEPEGTAPGAGRPGQADVLRAELVRLLDVGGEPDADDALDVLWIARLSGLDPVDWSQVGDGTDPTAAAPVIEPLPLPPPGTRPHHGSVPGPPSARLHLPDGGATAAVGSGGAHIVRVAQPPALPDVLPLGRALRPLRQPFLSAHAKILDVQATAAAYGDTGLLLPVLRPAVERRFSVDLLIDTSTTMTVWHRLAHELRTLLERHGAFVDVRAWALYTDEPEPSLAPFRRSARATSLTRHWREALADPSGRRVVLVLTDGVGPAWYGTELPLALADWSGRRPVAALQVLPSRLWNRTALRTSPVQGRGPEIDRGTIEVRSSGPLPGIARGRAGDTDRARIRWLPVLEVSGPWLRPWARLASGRTTDWTPLRAAPLTVVERPAPADASDDPATPAAWIERFEEGHSSDAFRLVRLLAAAPLSLPVMRLVQRTMLPASAPMHLAEIFLSGLLVRRTPFEPGEDPDRVLYDFREGVRDALLDRLTRTESVRVLRQVYEGVSERVAGTLGGVTDFAALVASAMEDRAEERDGVGLPEGSRAFAEVAWAVFNGVGGDYAELAARLGSGVAAPSREVRGEPRTAATEGTEDAAGERRRRGVWLPWRRNKGRDEAEDESAARVPSRIPRLPRPYVSRGVTSHVTEALLRGARPGGGVATCVIEGANGVGKTTLAVACARELAAEFTMVRWIRADSVVHLTMDLCELALDLGLGSRTLDNSTDALLSRLHLHLNDNPGWLLVYDGVSRDVAYHLDARDRLPGLLPPAGRGGVLVTVSDGAPWPGGRYEYVTVSLDEFSFDSALECVHSALASARGLVWESPSQLIALVEVVGTLPLELEKALVLLGRESMRVDDYIRLVLSRRTEVAKFLPSLVWISRNGAFVGTGVAVRKDAVITAVVDTGSGALEIHQANGREARVIGHAPHGLARPGLKLLRVSTAVLSPAAFSDRGDTVAVAAWYAPPGPDSDRPSLQLRHLPRPVPSFSTEAALIDSAGTLRGLASPTVDGGEGTLIRVDAGRVDSLESMFTTSHLQVSDQAPLFYLSYGRMPDVGPSNSQLRFFQQLSEHLVQLTHPGTTAVGFFDQRMRRGSRWEEPERALATARVFVPLYSPRYFASERCGREWDAFNRRQQWARRQDRFVRSAVVPVLWTAAPIHMPRAARVVEYSQFGSEYEQNGLRGLAESNPRLYRQVVFRIATTIVDVTLSSNLAPCDPSLFHDLRNAFAEEP
ncbi:TIR-like protein FxsC [Streptomyces canus]|uniref:TIR-like protein FxsC n=1 Tax=Streptomyces canus TaxID=58343 RepID=UPI003442E3EA